MLSDQTEELAVQAPSSFNNWYSLELAITKRHEKGGNTQVIIEMPDRKVATSLNRKDHYEKLWRDVYYNKFFALVASPVDPGELPPPLEWVLSSSEATLIWYADESLKSSSRKLDPPQSS